MYQRPSNIVTAARKLQGELRRKCEEMTAEINKMNTETEQHNKDNQTYTQMERKVRFGRLSTRLCECLHLELTNWATKNSRRCVSVA